MPTYIVLYKFTPQGRENVKNTVERASKVKEDNERRGFKMQVFWTMGQYDLVALLEAPSEEAMLNGLFSVAEAGNVESQTLRAFTAEEMQKALEGGTEVGNS